MKRILLIITALSVIVIFSANTFAQTYEEVSSQIAEKWVSKNYVETIKAVDTMERIDRKLLPIFLYYRAMSRVNLFIDKDVPDDTRIDFKYSPEVKSELYKAKDDLDRIFSDIEREKKNRVGGISFNQGFDENYALYTVGVVSNRLGRYFFHQPIFFQQSEKNLLKHLESKKPVVSSSYFLLTSQAGQYKFDEAIKTADKMLVDPAFDIGTTVRAVVDGFDMVGAFYQSEAFLLRTAKFLKAQNKPLSLIKVAVLSQRRNQAESLALENPKSDFELSRKGGMLVLTNKVVEAVPILDQALAKDKENLTAYRWHLMAVTRGTNREAIDRELEGLLNTARSGVLESTILGMATASAGNLASAERLLTSAVEQYPELAMFYGTFSHLAGVCDAQKKAEKLNATVTRAKELIALKAELDNSVNN